MRTIWIRASPGDKTMKGAGRGRPTINDLPLPARDLPGEYPILDAARHAVVITGPAIDPPGPVIRYVNPAMQEMTSSSRA
jgi:hypothetical protein